MSSEASLMTTDDSDHYILPLDKDVKRRFDEAAKELRIIDEHGNAVVRAEVVHWRDYSDTGFNMWYALVLDDKYARFSLNFEPLETSLVYTVGPVTVVEGKLNV